VHRGFRRAADGADEGQACEAGAFVEEIVCGEILQAEEFPPGCFVFAAMPVEDVGQKPLGVLFIRAGAAICGDAVGEARDKGAIRACHSDCASLGSGAAGIGRSIDAP
jgi:hypothetical protein